MKVKVGNRIYNGDSEPVMVILTDQDKKNIKNMKPESTKYCIFPVTDDWIKDDYAKIKAWMNKE